MEYREGNTESNARYTSLFYEGRASLHVGSVYNSKLEHCAILTGENSTVIGLNNLDLPSYDFSHLNTTNDLESRWIFSGLNIRIPSGFLMGHASYRVEDAFGAQTDMYLIPGDVNKYRFGLILSAWVFC